MRYLVERRDILRLRIQKWPMGVAAAAGSGRRVHNGLLDVECGQVDVC
jgi:hypothetical protein